MSVFRDKESHDRWIEEELPKISQRMHDDPSLVISLEELDRSILKWDAEDNSEQLRRSA